MKRLLILFVFIMFSAMMSVAQKGNKVFNDTVLHTLEINFYGDIDSTNGTVWNDTLFHYYREKIWDNIDEHIYFPAQVIFDGTTVKDSTGVRMKGLASTQNMIGKEAFKLDFNEFKKNADLNGLSKLNLQNEYSDRTMIANKLSYDMAHWMGFSAPRASFVKVYVNGDYYGLYTMVEEINSQFLNMHWPEEGDVFKPYYLKWNEEDSIDAVENVTPPKTWIEYKFNADNNDDNPDYSSILNAYRSIQTDMNSSIGDSLNNYFNLDDYIKHFAMDIALVAADNAFVGANGSNMYYRYDPVTEKLHTIPWDYNLNYQLTYYYNRVDELRKKISVDSSSVWGFYKNERPGIFDNAMHEKGILMHDENRNKLLDHLCHIKNEYYTENKIKAEIDFWNDLIEDAVLEDPNKRTYTSTLIKNQAFLNQREKLKSYIDTINTIIQEGLDFYGHSCPSYVPVTAIVPDFTEVTVEVGEIIEYNVDIVPANATYTSLTWEVEDKDIASTKFYGRIQGKTPGTTFVTIKSEDSSIIETITVHVYQDSVQGVNLSRDLVINEFMAKNDSTVADEFGEYDDWIELYNSTTEDISLLGYYLTDKTDGLLKWELPDTVIKAGDYIIVWADEDGSQGEMHANFKLSASNGETIRLINSNFDIVDSVAIEPHIVDTAFARIPNGIGDFYMNEATFSAYNTATWFGTQTIELNEGWNLVSLYIDSDNRQTGTVFPNASIIKTMDVFYDSSQPDFLNTLTTIEAGVGYLVYNGVDETILVNGVIETGGNIFLQDGWNLIGVPSSTPLPLSTYPDAKIIKDFDGFYEEGNDLNSLSELKPGKAYFIR